MNWFSKLATTAYTWTDLIIRSRQRKVDNAYNVKKAEEKAQEIMKQQQERNQKRAAREKRSVEGLEEEFDFEEYAEILQSLLEE